MSSITPPNIYIKHIPEINGFGVFASCNFSAGELIELAPVIPLSSDTYRSLDITELYNYYFAWNDGAAIGLGYASLYNHSFQNNAEYSQDIEARAIRITAKTSIKKDNEIRVDYTRGDSTKKLWFEPKEW